jgi:OOP family OmpA-OmpF porin
LAAALTAACGVAAAQGYAGALIGIGKMSVDGCTSGLSCDGSDTAFKVYGGYEVAPNIAIEVGYTSFGEATVKAGSVTGGIKTHSFSVGAAMRFPLTTELTGVGRLGVGFLKAKGTSVASGLADDATKAYVGFGLEYTLSSDIKLVSGLDLADGTDLYLFGVGAQVGF